MTEAQHYDVIVVGTGAGGAAIAHRLAPMGFDKHGEVESVTSVVACGAVNSAVLLLRSANDRHPQGPANSSDVVGRHDEAPRWAGTVCPDMPFEVLAHHAVGFWLCAEDLPTPDNRVTLDGDGGIHLALAEKNNIAGDRIADRPR